MQKIFISVNKGSKRSAHAKSVLLRLKRNPTISIYSNHHGNVLPPRNLYNSQRGQDIRFEYNPPARYLISSPSRNDNTNSLMKVATLLFNLTVHSHNSRRKRCLRLQCSCHF